MAVCKDEIWGIWGRKKKAHESTVILKREITFKKKKKGFYLPPNKCRKSGRIRESLCFSPYGNNRFRQGP